MKIEKGEKGLVLAGFVAAPEMVKVIVVPTAAVAERGLLKLNT